jgi:trans-aconitate methyltransferase
MAQSTSWDPRLYAENARFVSELGEPLLELLAPRPKELILDLGCGDGALSEKIAAYGCSLYAVDASYAQTEAARKRGLQALAMDGQRLSFKPVFDAVFTNAALHWMKEPDKVVGGVWHALKTGGRFVGEFGGKGNVNAIRTVLHDALRCRGLDPKAVDPWYYPSPAEYSVLLQQAGFVVEYIELIPRPTPLPGDIAAWLEIFAQPFTKAVEETGRKELIAEVRAELEPKLRQSDGTWIADYVRLRFRAIKPERTTGHGSKTTDH